MIFDSTARAFDAYERSTARAFDAYEREQALLEAQFWMLRLEGGSGVPYPIVKLGDGEQVGYGMSPHRLDECLRAAIATATQTPIQEVPDLRLTARLFAGVPADKINRDSWGTILQWADGRALRLTVHDQVPAARRRWIGMICNHRSPEPFTGHCLVMSHDELLFDPICTVDSPPGTRRRHFPPSMIEWGISFDRKE